MLGDPVTVTIDAVAQIMPRVNDQNFGGHYRKIATGVQYDLTVKHTTEANKLGQKEMDRHNVDLKYTTFDAEGLPTVYHVYTVVRTPKGADPTVVEKMWAGFNTWATANDAAIIGWQS